MLKKILLISLCFAYGISYAETNASEPVKHYNNPNVNSLAASNQQFPGQNNLTGEKGKKYNTSNAKAQNKPNVNSFMSSANQFKQQNELTGKKQQKYYTKEEMKNKKNKPLVNSRMSSENMFPQQNSY